MAKADSATEAPTESKMHRLRVGDTVSFEDTTDGQWPPDHLEGEITGFDNDEGSYLIIDFDGKEKTLTEDEVKRVG